MKFRKTTHREARAMGYTHDASYYGLPVFMGDLDNHEHGPRVAAQRECLDFLLSWISAVENLVHLTMPEPPEGFMFKIKGELHAG